MKNIIALTLMLAMAAPFGGVTTALADSSTDRLCGPDAPEGYKRPGGYCDQIDSKGSLMDHKEGCDYLPLNISMLLPTERLLVADCYQASKELAVAV
ncbi:hypothetical protein [Devosia sp. CN2-171]|jgi:hypothetical protein|uniref:hypothetical protein n=1 Tax=Devosia sp. CN2-171 TaxID=3400909 RepID=UPI003BF84DA1